MRDVAKPPTLPACAFEVEPNFEQRAKSFFEFEQKEQDVFRTTRLSTALQGSSKAAFGGLIFSQALAAAEKTVADDLKPHSMHSFFILNVDTSVPVDYNVRRTRDGRSFCTRSVEAIQNGKVAFSLQVSFHKVEPDSAVHQDSMPSVPHWSDLPSTKKLVPHLIKKIEAGELVLPDVALRRLKAYESRSIAEGDLFEMRPSDPDGQYNYAPKKDRTYYNWFRTKGDLGDCEKLHRYLVAYNTDSTMAGSVFRPHFVNGFEPSMIFSLDHVVYIHRHNLRADQWLLFETRSSYAGGARGLSHGRVWNEEGQLVLSCTQEALVRSRGSVSHL